MFVALKAKRVYNIPIDLYKLSCASYQTSRQRTRPSVAKQVTFAKILIKILESTAKHLM